MFHLETFLFSHVLNLCRVNVLVYACYANRALASSDQNAVSEWVSVKTLPSPLTAAIISPTNTHTVTSSTCTSPPQRYFLRRHGHPSRGSAHDSSVLSLTQVSLPTHLHSFHESPLKSNRYCLRSTTNSVPATGVRTRASLIRWLRKNHIPIMSSTSTKPFIPTYINEKIILSKRATVKNASKETETWGQVHILEPWRICPKVFVKKYILWFNSQSQFVSGETLSHFVPRDQSSTFGFVQNIAWQNAVRLLMSIAISRSAYIIKCNL